MIIVKKHFTADNKLILAICDKELIGQKFEQDELQLDLSSDFYKGDEISEEDLKKLIPKAYSINVVGKKSIKICVSLDVIDENKIENIKEVPFAYMVRF